MSAVAPSVGTNTKLSLGEPETQPRIQEEHILENDNESSDDYYSNDSQRSDANGHMAKLARKERQWRKKYVITDDTQQIIDKMDKIIKNKDEEEFIELKANLSEMLQKIIAGKNIKSRIIDKYELIHACQEFDLSYKRYKHEIEDFEQRAAKKLHKARKAQAKHLWETNSTSREALKNLSPIVVELLQELSADK